MHIPAESSGPGPGARNLVAGAPGAPGGTAHRPAARRRGFTLIELLFVLVVVGIIAVLLLPNFRVMLVRSKFESFVRQAQTVSTQAKLEAIRRGRPAVIWFDPDRYELIAYVDVHGSTAAEAPRPEDTGLQSYAPGDDAQVEQRRSDYLIGLPLKMPRNLRLEGPPGEDEVDGLTEVNTEGAIHRAIVYLPDGSVLDTGGLRFADEHENYLELRVAPQATARVSLRKWNEDLPDQPTGSGEHWYEFGEGGENWKWNF